jgi:hypothetical protein
MASPEMTPMMEARWQRWLGFACLGLGNPRIACDGFMIN